jgi:hypothetical protein
VSPTRVAARLRDRFTAWRTAEADLDRRARARLDAEESARATGPRRKSISLGEAWWAFWRHPSPWLISVTLLGAVVARVATGDWQVGDALVPFVMLAVFPFAEWMIHVFILHWRPRKVAGFTIDPLLSRKHREHHADPRDVPLVFLPWPVLLWLLPLNIGIAVLAFPRLGSGLTFLVILLALGFGYEWTHYLIHSDYRPRSRFYRAVWRNHRLHHYKNEHYWFTVTTSGTADRVLRTFPDPQQVPISPTAKNLHGA